MSHQATRTQGVRTTGHVKNTLPRKLRIPAVAAQRSPIYRYAKLFDAAFRNLPKPAEAAAASQLVPEHACLPARAPCASEPHKSDILRLLRREVVARLVAR